MPNILIDIQEIASMDTEEHTLLFWLIFKKAYPIPKLPTQTILIDVDPAYPDYFHTLLFLIDIEKGLP